MKGITHLKRLPCPWEAQLSTKFGASSYTQNGFPAKTILNFKRTWRAHFLSHTHETQEICCFLADLQIVLVSLFELFNHIKVAKNAGAFLSRCSELLDLHYFTYQKSLTHVEYEYFQTFETPCFETQSIKMGFSKQ